MKLQTITLLSVFALFVQSVNADPEERAQMVKARMLDKLVTDGWQLVNETHSMMVVERPMAGWGSFAVQALTTGANGTPPVVHWSITFIPVSDHYTKVPFSATINSQNAFGQLTTIPVKNPKAKAYILDVMAWASNRMPAKYKFIKSKE